MRKRILATISGVTALALVLAYAASMVFFYAESRAAVQSALRDEAVLIGAILNTRADDEQLMALSNYKEISNDPRLTFVATNGEVLYDSVADIRTMPNHANRSEIAAAMRTGAGQIVRSSATTNEIRMYYAQRLDNGRVIRVSRPIQSVTDISLRGLPILGGIALVMFVLAFLVARIQTGILMRPLEELDLDKPLAAPTYPEFVPLLERIDEQNHQKNTAEQSRREFSANVSHELKTPLTSISGYAELIHTGVAKPEDVPQFAGRIEQEALRLITLINDIIALSQLDEEEKATHVPQADIDLFALAKDVVERFAPTAQDFQVHMHVTGEPAVIAGQPRLIDELVTNLVDNAIKYNKPGGSVRIWAGIMREVPTVIVSDTGIGIALADQERIFERFYRVDKSHSKASGGTGLGLSIVKHVAAIHHAQISVHSQLGAGTRITVSFAPAQRHALPSAAGAAREKGAARGVSTARGASAQSAQSTESVVHTDSAESAVRTKHFESTKSEESTESPVPADSADSSDSTDSAASRNAADARENSDQ